MINILVFGISDNYGGVESVIMNYYRKINKKHFHIDFLCTTNKPAYREEIIRNGSKIIYISKRSSNFKQFYKDINKVFKNNKYDIFWDNECSLTNIEYLKYAKKYGVKKIIIHSHNSRLMHTGALKILFLLLHKFHKNSVEKYATDFWSCDSNSSKFFFSKKIINSNKHKIINNAIDSKKFIFDSNIRQSYRKKMHINNFYVIGHIGRLDFQKNQQFAIQLCNKLKNKIDVKLLLIGSGKNELKLKRMCKKISVSDNVLFLGSRKDIPQLLSVMDAFILPSIFEGFCVSNVEAQASGLFVYGSSNISENLQITKNCKFLSLKNINDWVNAILENVNKKIDRISANSEVRSAGFDINTEVKKIETYLAH